MNRLLYVVLVFALLVVACKSISNTNQSAQAPPKMSKEEATWRTVCTKCHRLGDANPHNYPAAEWPRIVQKMQDKKGGHQFTDKEKKLVIKYLVSHAAN